LAVLIFALIAWRKRREKMITNAPQRNVKANGQYCLLKILGLWMAAALPMALLGWVAHPALAARSGPLGSATIRVSLMTAGLIWQFVLSMIVVYREEGDLRWSTIRRRFWLQKPRDPKSGEPRGRLWLWLIPLALLLAAFTFFVSPALNGAWVKVLPFFAEPPQFALGPVLESPDVQAQLVGAWWFLALAVVMAVFNVFLGEEFLFRGVLLPKMEGTFGKWDWVANGVLMGAYHWHQPWGIPGNILSAVLFFAFPARRFRCTWIAVILHSLQYLVVLPMILALVLGLA
jgi:membrane protease YdiL (CAAX protease family)